MKKTIAWIMLAAVMTVSSCTSAMTAVKPDIDRAFCAEASVSAGGEAFSGKLCRTAENDWTFVLAEPYALEGLTVTFRDGKTTLSMDGFECETDFSADAVSVLKLIAEAYEAAADSTSNLENGVLEGMNENGAFSVTLGENGMPAVINACGCSLKLSERSETQPQEQGDELILLE